MSNHSKRKISKVCSEEAYDWLQKWIIDQNPNYPYPDTPMTHFYRNTIHREYLSKWIESVIVKILRSKGADPQKAPDKGQSIDKSKVVTDVLGMKRVIGSRVFVKQKGVRPGRADVTCFFNGKQYNMEIKVGNDRMSELQLIEQKRAISNGEQYIIIKTIDEFIKLL